MIKISIPSYRVKRACDSAVVMKKSVNFLFFDSRSNIPSHLVSHPCRPAAEETLIVREVVIILRK